MSAIMRANQPAGAGNGSDGLARNDLWLNQPIVLLDMGVLNTSWLWELLDVPLGSVATLSTPTSSTSGFTPDVLGTYRLRLSTNGGGPGNEQVRVFRVRYNNAGVLQNRGYCLPALGEGYIEGLAEANYTGNTRGHEEPFRQFMADAAANMGGGAPLTGPQFAARVSGTGNPQAVSPADAAGMLDDQFTQLFINTGALKVISIWNDGDEGYVEYGSSFVGCGMRQNTRASDLATANMAFEAQAPFVTATGTNRKPGNFVFTIAAPTNGGTTRGRFQVADVSEALLDVYRGAATGEAIWEAPTELTIRVAGSGTFIHVESDLVEMGLGSGSLDVAGDAGIRASEDGGSDWTFLQNGGIGNTQTIGAGGNVPSKNMQIVGAKASASATGANKVGGHTRFLGGEGLVTGTDKGGHVEVYLNAPIADNTTASFRVLHGTPGSSPTEMFSWTRDSYSRSYQSITGHHIVAGSGYLAAVYQDIVQIEAGNGAYGSLYLGAFWQQYAPSGDIRILGPSTLFRQGYTLAARVTTTDATVTTIASWASSAIASPGTVRVYDGFVMVQEIGGGEFKQAFHVRFSVYDVGGVQTIGTLESTGLAGLDDVVGEGTVAATPLTLDVSSNVVRLRGTGVAATTNRWSVTIKEVR